MASLLTTAESRTYSIERRLSPEWLVVVHFVLASPLRALVYVEAKDGRVADVWLGQYENMRELWTKTLDRVVFGREL